MAKLWLLDFNYCQNNKGQWKNLRVFLNPLDTITGYLLFLFICLFIYYIYYNLSLSKFFWHAEAVPLRYSLRGGCCEFSVAYLYAGVILIKFQSGFVEIALLHCFSCVSLLHVCRASFLQSTSGGLLRNKYTFEDFKVSVLL